MCFLECFQCSLLGLLRDCILHVFSRAFLQVCGWNTQTLHFPRVFSIEIDVIPRLILYVFCRVFRRFGLLLYDSACPLVRWFSFYWVFLNVFDSFYEHHLETLWMHVFNGCVKVFIFSSISGLVSCIARVFSSFLAVGWLAGYGWAGWLAARWLPGWWVWFSRDVSRILHSLAKGGASVTSLHVFSRGICIFALMAQSWIVVFVILHVFSRAFLQIWLLEHWNITFSSCFLVENWPATKLDFSSVFLCLLKILLIFITFSLITSTWILVLLCFPSVFECFCEVLWTLSWRHFARMFSMGVRKY